MNPTIERKTSNYLVLVPYDSIDISIRRLKPLVRQQKTKIHLDNNPIGSLSCSESKTQYINKIKQLKAHIQRGDVYEINYCIEFFVEQIEIDPVDVFEKIKEKTDAPFSFLTKHEDTWIICASPERFIQKIGDKLITQPMKGTTARSTDVVVDEKNKSDLKNDPKQRSENVMAVDVARNDLSRIAKKGTVKMDELFGVHTFKNVHQMISTISCELKPNLTLENILSATFPMASMTGAPKIRAIELIEQYESFKRGFYSGCLGKVYENGDFDLWVLIRTIFWNEKTKRLSIPVGGAITAASDPEAEWEECLIKIRSLASALELALP